MSILCLFQIGLRHLLPVQLAMQENAQNLWETPATQSGDPPPPGQSPENFVHVYVPFTFLIKGYFRRVSKRILQNREIARKVKSNL